MDDLGNENPKNKLLQKMKDNPFMPLGVTGLIIACLIGAYQFKNKGKMSTSVYLMQLRVAAQGTVVGTLALGVGYQLLKDNGFLFSKKEE